jgi:hypothetical protein
LAQTSSANSASPAIIMSFASRISIMGFPVFG